jgi:hypothetical protein
MAGTAKDNEKPNRINHSRIRVPRNLYAHSTARPT